MRETSQVSEPGCFAHLMNALQYPNFILHRWVKQRCEHTLQSLLTHLFRHLLWLYNLAVVRSTGVNVVSRHVPWLT